MSNYSVNWSKISTDPKVGSLQLFGLFYGRLCHNLNVDRSAISYQENLQLVNLARQYAIEALQEYSESLSAILDQKLID